MDLKEPSFVQQCDLTDPVGAWNFHVLLETKDFPHAVDFSRTIVLQRPRCFSDGNASAHMLTMSRYSDLWNAYATLLAKVTYRSVAKQTAQTAQLLVQSTFPGAGRWSGYWNAERGSLKRTVQDMLLHNMMGIPVYGADVCDLHNGVDATTYDACSRDPQNSWKPTCPEAPGMSRTEGAESKALAKSSSCQNRSPLWYLSSFERAVLSL
ncbi:hypothetical protein HPB49_006647 [Dermacentor silvarum]|uniref:Uncharacterized protein n=1 Tax=Dermacentor silvarum TaxID=543639 RepID=A0ACB8CQI4_DERSI|nr:hypothetical protein HPB49_006647 [Dermacentor silvarum]